MPNAVDIFWRLPSDRLDVATVGFGNSLLLDLRIYLHYLRAVVCPRFRAKDDLSLVPHREYDDLLAGSAETVRRILPPFLEEFAGVPLWRIWNGTYESADAQFYYSMVRHIRPHEIIEVGAGYSTWFAACALARNGVTAIHRVIDPWPRVARLPAGVKHLRRRVEEVPVEEFENLHENDILFIDSSHTTDEALYHVQEVLPRLRSGVLIHHHDICYPYVYPPYLQPVAQFGESDIVLQFYQTHRETFEVLAGLAFARHRLDDRELLALVPSMRWNQNYYPGALWARRK